MTEYLKTARQNGLKADSTTSEAELIATSENFADNWNELMTLKKKIADEKLAALKAIDDKYREELTEAESNYALILSISR
jgi:hypothetical protein